MEDYKNSSIWNPFGTQSKHEVGQRKVIKHYGQGIYESTIEFYELCLNDHTLFRKLI